MAKSARPNRLERLPKVWYNLGIALCLGIIAACVIGCALTVYIFKYIADEPVVDLDAAQMSYTTILYGCLLNTSPSPRDDTISRMQSEA